MSQRKENKKRLFVSDYFLLKLSFLTITSFAGTLREGLLNGFCKNTY